MSQRVLAKVSGVKVADRNRGTVAMYWPVVKTLYLVLIGGLLVLFKLMTLNGGPFPRTVHCPRTPSANACYEHSALYVSWQQAKHT